MHVEPVFGDFDGDGQLTATDIDLLSTAVGSGDTLFDLDGNGAVEAEDRRIWVEDVYGTFFGDADLNKSVEFADFVTLANHFDRSGGWGEGDFDADRHVQFADFLILANNYGKTSTANTMAVPEPNSELLTLLGVALLAGVRNRRRS